MQSAPFAICIKPWRPEAAPIIRGSVLIALVIATGEAAPTPIEKRIIGPSTVARLSLLVTAARKNSAAPRTARALVARSSRPMRIRDASRLDAKLHTGMPLITAR